MKHSPFVRSKLCIIAVAVAGSAFMEVATAQLEEIVVTARKREESMQDVPISVQAFTGEFIDEQGIFSIQEIAPYTPNFTYATGAGASDVLIMRGVGTHGSGIHFEPSVGQVFNGYFSTRSRLGRSALLDVAQVEVLKGPQGPIIGKNTSVGAINITSHRPTEEFEGRVMATYGFEAAEGPEVEGMISGPLGDKVRGRAVVNYRDVEGWLTARNQEGDKQQERKDLTARFMLDVDFSENFTGEFMYQRTDLDRDGKTREVTDCLTPSGLAQGFDCKLDTNSQHVNIRQGVNVGEPYTTELDMFGATFNWEFEDFTISSLTSYTDYTVSDMFSGDLLSTERASIDNFEDYSQFTQELRLVSNGNDTLDYIAGVMYFDGDMDFTQDFQWLIPFNFNRHEVAASTTESIAAFGQIDWHINEAINLTLGARVTDEERTGLRQQVVREIYTENTRLDWCNNRLSSGNMGPPVVGPRTCTAGNDGLQPAGTPLTGQFSDTVTSWNAALQWSPDDNSMFYVSAATGFKSGGFDLRGAGDPSKFVFPKEESMQYELGGKHMLANGRLRVNWALFQLEVDDLQLSTNDPILIQQVVGQAEVTSKGFEWDTVWAVTDEFNLTWQGAYLDSTYDRFRSNCYLGQSAAQGCDSGTQDLSGQRLVFTPEWSSVLGADYTWAVSNDMEVTVSGKWIYIDSFDNMVDKDPRAVSDSSSRFDATLALSGNIGEANPWSVALVGRNLSDELVRQWCNSSGLSGAPVVSCTVEEPRYVALRATVGF